MRMRYVFLGSAALLVLLPPPAASAHAKLSHATPSVGSLAGVVPDRITLSFDEGLAAESQVTVADGCHRTVNSSVTADQTDLVVTLKGGQPGAWTVSYLSVSADDGHPSSGTYSFTVAGTGHCTADPVTSLRGSASTASSGNVSSGPLAITLLGTAALTAAGVGLRRRTGRGQ